MGEIAETTGLLFGSCWPEFTDQQFKHSVELFRKRALANKFDLSWIKNKTCIDAGCGSARYSVALALSGAKEVTALDVSKTGLEEAKKRTKGLDQIKFVNASVLEIPFKDESFDFVWSAGVIHHTTDFNKALSELARINKSKGKLFLLIYGSGGLRWKAIKSLRPIVKDLGDTFLSKSIDHSGLPANNKYHFRDDLTVPIQKLTTFEEISSLLKASGYINITRWIGETFDHESDIGESLIDVKKQLKVCESMKMIAKSELEKSLSSLCYEITLNYVNEITSIIENNRMDNKIKKDLIIGEGNHRIIADKS